MGMKYIIVKRGGLELPIVFDEIFNHSDIGYGADVVAAGFCNIGDRGESEPTWACWGKSTTLNVVSRGEVDDAILNRMSTLY